MWKWGLNWWLKRSQRSTARETLKIRESSRTTRRRDRELRNLIGQAVCHRWNIFQFRSSMITWKAALLGLFYLLVQLRWVISWLRRKFYHHWTEKYCIRPCSNFKKASVCSTSSLLRRKQQVKCTLILKWAKVWAPEPVESWLQRTTQFAEAETLRASWVIMTSLVQYVAPSVVVHVTIALYS